VLEADPENFQALFGLGRWLLTQGQSAVALDLLRRAQAVAPEGANINAALSGALIAQGNAAYADGNMAQAEQLYREAIGFGRDLVAAHNNLGNALTGQLRLPEALEAYRAALAIDPNADNAGFAYSLCLLLAGDEAEGRRRFEHRRLVEPAGFTTVAAGRGFDRTACAAERRTRQRRSDPVRSFCPGPGENRRRRGAGDAVAAGRAVPGYARHRAGDRVG
jgi:tetratricopeptide (TPR) repeat protein